MENKRTETNKTVLLLYCICFVAVLHMVIFLQTSLQMKYTNMHMKYYVHR